MILRQCIFLRCYFANAFVHFVHVLHFSHLSLAKHCPSINTCTHADRHSRGQRLAPHIHTQIYHWSRCLGSDKGHMKENWVVLWPEGKIGGHNFVIWAKTRIPRGTALRKFKMRGSFFGFFVFFPVWQIQNIFNQSTLLIDFKFRSSKKFPMVSCYLKLNPEASMSAKDAPGACWGAVMLAVIISNVWEPLVTGKHKGGGWCEPRFLTCQHWGIQSVNKTLQLKEG